MAEAKTMGSENKGNRNAHSLSNQSCPCGCSYASSGSKGKTANNTSDIYAHWRSFNIPFLSFYGVQHYFQQLCIRNTFGSRMGKFNSTAAAARAISAYHIQP